MDNFVDLTRSKKREINNISTISQMPSIKSTTEETRSQVTSCSTETNSVREYRDREAKTTVKAWFPYSWGGLGYRSNYSNYDTETAPGTRVYQKPMLARKSTATTGRPRGRIRGRGRGRPRGGVQRRYQPEETERRGENPACGDGDASSTGRIDLLSKNEQESIEASNRVQPMEIDDQPESESAKNDSALKPFEEPRPESINKCSVQLPRIDVEPEPIATDDIDTASSSIDGYVQFDERFDPGPESDDCFEKEVREPKEISPCTNEVENHTMPKIFETEAKAIREHRRGDVPRKLIKPKKTLKNSGDATSQIEDKFEASWLESNETSEIIKPKKKRGRKPKNKAQTIPVEHKSANINGNPGVGTEDSSILAARNTEPKAKRKRTTTSTSPKKRIKSGIIDSTNLPTDIKTLDTVLENEALSKRLAKSPKLEVKRRRWRKKFITSEIIGTEEKAQDNIYPKTKSPLKILQSKALLRHALRCPITDKNKYLLSNPKHQPILKLWNIANGDRLSKKQKEFLQAQKLRNQTLRSEDVTVSKPNCNVENTIPKSVEETPKTIHVQQFRRKLQRINDQSQGRKKKTTKERQQRRKKTTIPRNKAQKKIYGEKSTELQKFPESVRCPDTIGTSVSESGVLSVFENDGSVFQASNFGSNVTSTNQEVIVVPENLVVSGMAVGQPTRFLTPLNSLVTEPLPQNDGTNERTNRLGSSTFNVTDLSNSFIELIDDQTGTIVNPGEVIFKNPNLQDNEYREENITLHRSDYNDYVYPITSNASNDDPSLPALDHFNKLPTTSVQKSDGVEAFEELQQMKINFGSYEIQDQPSGIDPIICDVNWNDASDRRVEGLDTNDVCSPEVNRRPRNKKSMPTIISDETFPRGSMELASICCRSPGFSSSHNNNNGTDGNEEMRELTIHNQSTYTSVVNLRQSDEHMINFGCDAVDNSRPFENIDEEPLPSNRQDDPIDMKQSNRTSENCDPIDDPYKLWRLCHDLGDEYVNNNNDESYNHDKIHPDPEGTHAELISDDFDANMFENIVSRGVLATKDCPYEAQSESSASVESHGPSTSFKPSVQLATKDCLHEAQLELSASVESHGPSTSFKPSVQLATKDCPHEAQSESSASVESHGPSTSFKPSVQLAVLTETNLKKFTVLTNRHGKGGGSDWSEEQCRKYLRENDSEKSNVKNIPDAGADIGCKATEYIHNSETDFSQAGSKKPKRKWIKEERDTSLEEKQPKRLKLDRKTWRNDRIKDSDNVDNSLVRSSMGGSVCSENANAAKNTRFENKSNRMEAIIEDVQIEGNRNPVEMDETIQISPKKMDNNEANGSSTICFDTNINLLTETQARHSEEETLVDNLLLLQGKIRSSRSSQDTQNENDCNKSVDSSGSSSSSSSTSNSSSSDSSSSTTSQNISPSPEKLIQEEMVQDDAEPAKPAEPPSIDNKINQEVDDEVDEDVISLGGNSMFTMYNDHATDVGDRIGMTSLDEPRRELSSDNYREMPNFGVYLDENIKECNEAYESCKQDTPVRSTSNQQSGTQKASTTALASEGSICSNAEMSQRLIPLTSYPLNVPSAYDVFHGRCFGRLRRGRCVNKNCGYSHDFSHLENFERAGAQQIMNVICTAMSRKFKYFVVGMYPRVIQYTDYLSIVRMFYELIVRGLMNVRLVQTTFTTLNKRGISLTKFVKDASTMVDEHGRTLEINQLWQLIGDAVPLGIYWDTFRELLIGMTPLRLTTETVIAECISTNKDESHIKDVYENYVIKLTGKQLDNLPINLREKFESLLIEHNLIYRPVSTDRFMALENATDTANLSPSSPTNLSPDDPVCSPRHSSEPIFAVPATVKLEQTTDSITPVSPVGREEPTPDPNVRIPESSDAATDSTSNNRVLKPIDDLIPSRSVWAEPDIFYHKLTTRVINALKQNDYASVLEDLNKYSDKDRSLVTSECYQILRKNVMTSAQHVKRLIELSVRIGVSNTTHQILSDLGAYVMVRLCDTNAWVLAYDLFKSLKYYDLTKKVATFALIAAQICLANRRPLKAFNILKQNNMFCTRRNKWQVDESIPNDEDYRVEVIVSLLRSLCDGYADHAYYIFTYILTEQTRIYLPIDLTRCVDKLVLCILRENSKELIIDIGRLVIERNFRLEDSTFKSLVVGLFEHDVLLSKRLYRYSNELGLYSTIELTRPLHVLIKTDYKREEMYLVVEDFVNKLSMEIGPAVGRLGPNHFTIFLIFELAPFEKNPDGMCNTDELKASKKLMKTVLTEDFNPPLKTIKAEQERSLKLLSRSVVDYLKSLNA